MYGGVVLALIVLFGKETYVEPNHPCALSNFCICAGYRMYDRHLTDPHPFPRPKSWLHKRFEMLSGITGMRMAKYRATWHESLISCANVAWRPQIIGILIFEVVSFTLHLMLPGTDII